MVMYNKPKEKMERRKNGKKKKSKRKKRKLGEQRNGIDDLRQPPLSW